MAKCKHKRTETGDPQCYSASVAVYPHTYENPMAHGGVRFVETCLDCGATRKINSNGRHQEYSPWSLHPENAAK